MYRAGPRLAFLAFAGLIARRRPQSLATPANILAAKESVQIPHQTVFARDDVIQ
jgi:hypothetical protein